MRTVLLVVAALLAAPSVATAAPPWSEPITVGPGASFVTAPSIAFGPSDAMRLSWFAYADSEGPAVRRSATVEPDGRIAQGRTAKGPEPIPLPRGRELVLRSRSLGTDGDFNPRIDLRAAVRSASGREGPSRRLGRFVLASGLESAVSADGVPAVAWIELLPRRRGEFDGRSRIRLAVGGTGGRLGAPRTVADLGEQEPTGSAPLALAFAGDRLVIAYRRETYRRGHRVLRRVETLIGRPGGPLTRDLLGPHAGRVGLDVAASRRGRIAVVWGTQDGGEEADKPYVVRAAIRERGQTQFGPARVIDPGGDPARPWADPRVDLDANGDAVALWANATGESGFEDSSPVLAATAPVGEAFGGRQRLTKNGVPGAIAFRSPDRVLLTWSSLIEEEENLGRGAPFAAHGLTWKRFGPAEQVAPESERAGPPSAAFDPRTGEPVVAWSSRSPDGETDVPRFSRRDP